MTTWAIDIRQPGRALPDYFDPAKSMLWASAATGLEEPEPEAQVFEELARVVVSKFPAEPAESLAAKTKHLRAFLAGMIGCEAAQRFYETGELGSTVVLLRTRYGWLHFCPGATDPRQQLLHPCCGELAVDFQE